MLIDSDVEIHKYWFVEFIQFRLSMISWKSCFMRGFQLILPSISANSEQAKTLYNVKRKSFIIWIACVGETQQSLNLKQELHTVTTKYYWID